MMQDIVAFTGKPQAREASQMQMVLFQDTNNATGRSAPTPVSVSEVPNPSSPCGSNPTPDLGHRRGASLGSLGNDLFKVKCSMKNCEVQVLRQPSKNLDCSE